MVDSDEINDGRYDGGGEIDDLGNSEIDGGNDYITKESGDDHSDDGDDGDDHSDYGDDHGVDHGDGGGKNDNSDDGNDD